MSLPARFARSFAAALAIVVLALPLSAQTPRSDAPASTAIAAPAIRIDNFGRVNAGYFRGAQPEGRDYADLRALGVQTVIDLQKDGDEEEAAMVQRAGMKFLRIPMTTRETPSREKVERFLQIVKDPANQPVYVHCKGGRHRTGVMTAVYRMTNERWTADRAFAEMKQYKFGADFLHPEFKRFVFEYGSELARTAVASGS